MMELLEDEYDPKVLTMTTEASIEEAEIKTRLSERLQRWRRWCVYK